MTGPYNPSPADSSGGHQPYGQQPSGQEPQYGTPQWSAAGPPPPPAKKDRKGLFIVLGVLGLLVVIGLIGNAVSGADNKDDSEKVADPTSATTYSLSPAQKEANERHIADAQRKSAEAQAEVDAAAQVELRAQQDPASYEQITERDWQMLTKDPDANTGRKIVLYGSVTQFDSVTGTTAFRANTAGEQMGRSYEYDVNTIVREGTPGAFDQVVEDDLITLYVEIAGTESYDTTVGGSTTVPVVQAYIVDVTGTD